MKNLVITILVLISIVAGYFAIKSQLHISLESLEGKTAKLTRGDLTLPIKAQGDVLPTRRVILKAEASGEVIEIVKRAGDTVRQGDILIRLQPDEEQRSANRAKLDLNIAEARLESTKIALEQLKTTETQKAKDTVDRLDAALVLAKFKKDKLAEMQAHQRAGEETLEKETTVRSQQAQLNSARADLEAIALNIRRAEQDVKREQSSYETAKNNLADAEKRLAKTEIAAPMNGIVGDIYVQIGEVIQGAKTTFGTGTVLASVLDVETLVVRAEVDEADIARVLAIAPPWAQPGNDGSVPEPADIAKAMALSPRPLPTLTVEALRDRKFEGVIHRVYPEPEVKQSITSYNVDVAIVAAETGKLLPGMRADVSFTSDHVENVVLCPNEAIREGTRGGLGVYVPDPNAPAEERLTTFISCVFGLDNGNFSQVLCDELKEGSVVYVKLPVKKEEKDEKKNRKDRRKRENA
ncbi:MAG: hypothetical protein AABZ47_03335 [Planctomycetota bacterium]